MVKLVGTILVLFVLVTIGSCSCTVVDPGTRGVQVTLGTINPHPIGEGFHVVNPLSTVTKISVRQNTKETPADTFSSDLQQVTVKLQLLYRVPPESVVTVYQNYAGDPFASLIVPRTQEALKEVTATMTAEQIVKHREEVKQKALASARAKIGALLILDDLVIENVDLSEQLEHAIESKMVQEQEAAKARFIQQKATIDAETTIVRAKGEAESIRIRGEALRQNPKVIEMVMVEKWNGVAPLVTGGGNQGPSIILPVGKE